jgi:flagellar basal body-associated protein FliL
MESKKGSVLVWILVILILVVVGVVLWLVFGGSSGGIPTPPVLPEGASLAIDNSENSGGKLLLPPELPS